MNRICCILLQGLGTKVSNIHKHTYISSKFFNANIRQLKLYIGGARL